MANALVKPGGRVCIIGAGSAGLAAARVMRDAGFKPTVFECGNEVGGTWNYTHETSAMYRGLRCNIPKEVMAYRCYPMPSKYQHSYLTHRQVHQYLIDYSIRFSLRSCIRFCSTVVGIANLPDGRWSVDVLHTKSDAFDDQSQAVPNAQAQSKASYQFDAVCVANGHFTRPNSYIPPGTAAFCSDGTRTVSHSRSYRVPDPYIGRRVVVVGASASGTDIALELERSGAKQVILAHNSGRVGEFFASTIPETPSIHALSADGTVTFDDGHKVYNIDDVLLCTGYVYDLSFLNPNNTTGVTTGATNGVTNGPGLSVSDDGRLVEGLVSHCVALKNPTLAMIGVPYNVLPFPMFEDQALFYAAVLKGHVTKSQLDKLHNLELEENRTLDLPHKYLHKLMDRQWEYRRRMASLAGFDPPSIAQIEVYNDSRAARRRDIRNYRDNVYKIFGSGPGQWCVFEDGEDVAGKYDLGHIRQITPLGSPIYQ